MENLKRLSVFIMLGFVISANAQGSTVESTTSKQDTLVVIVKHEKRDVFFERKGKPFKRGYKAVETAVVDGYKAVERTFVNGYKSVEKEFVDKFTDSVSTSINHKRGYRANVELYALVPDTWGITSSHGFSFGNGFYLGGGVGFAAEFTPNYKSKPTYLVPVFADLKYSFINRLASPFVNLSTGAYADITNTGIRYFVNPSLGVDIGRFAINVGYEYQIGVWKHNKGRGKHNAKIGVAFTF